MTDVHNRPRRLVIVVRADPVICGHSGEARNLAEVALERGFNEVRIITWPLEALTQLPLKPLDSVLPYSEGITVERPEPVGDYKVPDGRYAGGLVGRLVELFTDGVPTVCLDLYLMPHAHLVMEALSVARALGRPVPVITIAEAVGSDITNVARSCVASGRLGAASHLFASYLAHDHCVAVSEYTRKLIIAAAEEIDGRFATTFAPQCRERVGVSYPAVDSARFTGTGPEEVDRVLAGRGLRRDGYALFLSRITPAKGVDDLIDGFALAESRHHVELVIAGTGAAAAEMRERADRAGIIDRVRFFDDVGDEEKIALMAGSAAYVLPSKPRAEFVETFGIALVEKMLAGGGPVITTSTGGIPEAVGDTAVIVPIEDPAALAAALDRVVLHLDERERATHAERARAYALEFDRFVVFDRLFERVLGSTDPITLN